MSPMPFCACALRDVCECAARVRLVTGARGPPGRAVCCASVIVLTARRSSPARVPLGRRSSSCSAGAPLSRRLACRSVATRAPLMCRSRVARARCTGALLGRVARTPLRRPAQDPERIGVHLDHLAFYYKRYFSKELRPKEPLAAASAGLRRRASPSQLRSEAALGSQPAPEHPSPACHDRGGCTPYSSYSYLSSCASVARAGAVAAAAATVAPLFSSRPAAHGQSAWPNAASAASTGPGTVSDGAGAAKSLSTIVFRLLGSGVRHTGGSQSVVFRGEARRYPEWKAQFLASLMSKAETNMNMWVQWGRAKTPCHQQISTLRQSKQSSHGAALQPFSRSLVELPMATVWERRGCA